MADFCRGCTIEYFGEEFADKNDMINNCEDDEMISALCEGCGWGFFDNKGNRLSIEHPKETFN